MNTMPLLKTDRTPERVPPTVFTPLVLLPATRLGIA
jgi:hypothetical protein